MKPAAYHRMASSESGHWYYVSRARAIETLIRRYVHADCAHPEILDIGCGTGGTSARLAQLGSLIGLEPSSIAIESLRSRYPSLEVVQGTVDELPTLIPNSRFDLVTVLGVLCHRGVRDPGATLDRIAAQLRNGGWILWGDCVYPSLARPHDEFVEAGRRFYPAQMHDMLRGAGFDIVFSSHFLGWGFPIAWGMAALHRLFLATGRAQADASAESPDDRPLPAVLNTWLTQMTYWEWRLGLSGLKAPLGVSRLVLARKTFQSSALSERTSHCTLQPIATVI